MKKLLLLTTALFCVVAPANAKLQIAFTDGASVTTCADGQACDRAGGASDFISLDETVGDFHVIGTAAVVTNIIGDSNLQLSMSLIENTGSALGHLGIVLGGTGILPQPPQNAIFELVTLPFYTPSVSTVRFFADRANGQPAGVGLNVPGVQLYNGLGVNVAPFSAAGPFSMTETADLALPGGGRVAGVGLSMQTFAVPEPRTWAMMVIGFALMGFRSTSLARRQKEH